MLIRLGSEVEIGLVVGGDGLSKGNYFPATVILPNSLSRNRIIDNLQIPNGENCR